MAPSGRDPAENAKSLKNVDTPGMDASMGSNYPYIRYLARVGGPLPRLVPEAAVLAVQPVTCGGTLDRL